MIFFWILSTTQLSHLTKNLDWRTFFYHQSKTLSLELMILFGYSGRDSRILLYIDVITWLFHRSFQDCSLFLILVLVLFTLLIPLITPVFISSALITFLTLSILTLFITGIGQSLVYGFAFSLIVATSV